MLLHSVTSPSESDEMKPCEGKPKKKGLQLHCKDKTILVGENLIMPFVHNTHYHSYSEKTVSISITVPYFRGL